MEPIKEYEIICSLGKLYIAVVFVDSIWGITLILSIG